MNNPKSKAPKPLPEMSAADIERFWSKVDKTNEEGLVPREGNRFGLVDGCWPWTAGRKRGGHGQFNFGGRSSSAHRVSFVLAYGEPEPGLLILHKCGQAPCVNPEHLYAGTHKENMEDALAMGEGRATVQDHEALAGLIRNKVIGQPQRQVAAKIGVFQASLSQWANREVRPNLMDELDNILEGGEMTGTGAQALRLLRTGKKSA